MFNPIAGVNDGYTFEQYAQLYFSNLWGVDLQKDSVLVGGRVEKNFDLVSSDLRYVGDAKWLGNVPNPAAKYDAISAYVWLLQKVSAEKVFLAFGRDVEIAERYLNRFHPIVAPVEFYYLDSSGHHLLT